MMLSMVPAAGAAEVPEAAEPEIAVEEITSREDLAREIESAQLADAAKLTDEEIAAREETRHARLEALFADLECAEVTEDGMMPLPEAAALNAAATDYTIKVTLNFSSAATKDTRIQIDLYDNENYFGAWYDVDEQTLKKGSKTLTFSVPVSKGVYTLEMRGIGSSTGWMYADIYGALSSEYENRLYVGAFGDDKTIEVVIDGDQLLKVSEEEEEPVGSDVKVTVNLPAKTTEERRYRTFLRSGNSTAVWSENVASGKTSYTETMSTTFSTFVVGYYDGTNVDSSYNVRYAAGVRYLAKDGGITSQFSEAKVFTASETSSITIDDTNNYAMTGKLKLESGWEYNKGMYAFAEFEDGECYAGRAYFPAGTTSAEYTIYIPKDKANSKFTHWAAETEDWNSNRVLENSYLEGKEYTLTKSGTLSDITLPDPPVTVKGTFSLPAGMKAPSGGLNVAISIENHSQVYTLAAGKSSFDFEMTPVINEGEQYNVWAYIENAPDNLCDEFRNRYMGSELMDVDMTAYETVIVSGSLEVPDACKEKGSTINLYAYTNVDENRWYNNNFYISVLPGQTSAAYEIKALKGYEDSYVSANVEADATGKLLTTELYLQEDGTTSTDNCWFALTKNMSDVDFVYALGKSISGKVTLAEGLDSGYYYGEVCARPTKGGDTYRTNFYFDGAEGSYALAVPQDYTGSYRVYYYIYSDENPNALTDCQIYYSESGMTTNYNKATEILVPEAGVEGIDLVILKAKFITGTITAPAGMPATAYYSGRVRAQNMNTDAQYSASFDFNGAQFSYSMGIPVDEVGPLYVSIYMYDDSAEGVMTGQYCYWSNSGMVFDWKKATTVSPTENGATVNLTIPKGIIASGSVSIPSSLPANGGYEGWVGLESENGSRYTGNFDFGEGKTSYSVSLPADYTGTYTLVLYLYEEDGVTPDNLLTYTYMYLTENGTFSTSENDAKKFTVGEAGLVQDVVIPVGQKFTVNLSAPSGFSGDYSGEIRLVNAATNSSKYESFSFTNSGSVSFMTLAGDTTQYNLGIYVYEGPGAMTGNTYYYANGSWVKNSNSATPFTTESGSISVSLPAGKTITGKLVSSSGDAITLPESPGYMYLTEADGYSNYNNATSSIDANGNFVITIPEDASGSYALYFYPYSSSGSNVVAGENYYYVKDASTAHFEKDDATALDISNPISGLELVVDTGYVMTGTIKLGEGATLNNSHVDEGDSIADVGVILSEQVAEGEDGFYSRTYVYLTKGSTSWNYSVVVPKKTATYSMRLGELDFNSNTTSNLYDGELLLNDNLVISGSGTLPTVELKPAKHTIQATITKPVTGYVSGQVYVLIDEDTYYSDSFSISSSETSTTVDIRIPATEDATSYKLYYYAYNTDGIYCNRNVYVAADGSLTADETLAASFDWTKTTHSFTMMELPPYATGKIYLPECTDDTSFSIRLYGYSTYTTFEVNSNTIQTDADGNQYIPYELSNMYATPGNTYLLGYCLYNYEGTELYYKGTSSSYRAYVTATGEVIYQYDYNNAFTIPESGANVLDFTLATWDDGSEENIFQSMHGIPSYTTMPTYTYTYPGAVRLQVTFSERTDTNLTINGDTYYYSNLNYGYPVTIDVSDTNGVMTITGYNGTGRSVYGFGITKIVPEYASYPTAPAVASVYTDNGSTDEIVMNDLRSGETVRVSLAGPADASGTLFAAIYDSTGKMLDVSMENVTFSNGCAASTLDFDSVEGAAKLQIMLVNNTSGLAPQMDAKTITG